LTLRLRSGQALHRLFYDLVAYVAHGEYAESQYVTFGYAHNTPGDKRTEPPPDLGSPRQIGEL